MEVGVLKAETPVLLNGDFNRVVEDCILYAYRLLGGGQAADLLILYSVNGGNSLAIHRVSTRYPQGKDTIKADEE